MNNELQVKICGLTREKEAVMLKNSNVRYAGIVMFFEKSRRNTTVEAAKKILEPLKEYKICTVAVTVSPTIDQVKIIERLGFDIIQIHGELYKDVLNETRLPVLRAFNESNIYEYHCCRGNKKVIGYVFDGAKSGSGRTFDWSIIENIERDNKLIFLAGGLNENNLEDAVRKVSPDVVDISSGAENSAGQKSEEKIIAIANIAEKLNSERRTHRNGG